jgi:CheY-like chemotaxis protein
MPGMDGIETVRIIRGEIGTDYARNVPIIALTANAILGNEGMFLEHGFQAFISKPIDVIVLDSTLRKWVRDKKRERERYAEPGQAAPNGLPTLPGHSGATPGGAPSPFSDATPLLSDIKIDGIDVTAGLERFAGDGEAYVKLLQSYAVNTRPLLDDMKRYLASGSLGDYIITVHGIRGSSLGMGAKKAGTEAGRLERLALADEKTLLSVENDAFMEYMESLLTSIDNTVGEYTSKTKKPLLAAPDPALLQELREACTEYDAGRVDSIMSRLESHEYESGAELIVWLRGQIEDMNYDEVAEGKYDDR